jgi:transposase
VSSVAFDTHKFTHHAAVVDLNGRLLGDRRFAADASGRAALVGWLNSFGDVRAVGVEGTGGYGVSLTRSLTGAGHSVTERAACSASSWSDFPFARRAVRFARSHRDSRPEEQVWTG